MSIPRPLQGEPQAGEALESLPPDPVPKCSRDQRSPQYSGRSPRPPGAPQPMARPAHPSGTVESAGIYNQDPTQPLTLGGYEHLRGLQGLSGPFRGHRPPTEHVLPAPSTQPSVKVVPSAGDSPTLSNVLLPACRLLPCSAPGPGPHHRLGAASGGKHRPRCNPAPSGGPVGAGACLGSHREEEVRGESWRNRREAVLDVPLHQQVTCSRAESPGRLGHYLQGSLVLPPNTRTPVVGEVTGDSPAWRPPAQCWCGYLVSPPAEGSPIWLPSFQAGGPSPPHPCRSSTLSEKHSQSLLAGGAPLFICLNCFIPTSLRRREEMGGWREGRFGS